jgi:hypothetical protein
MLTVIQLLRSLPSPPVPPVTTTTAFASSIQLTWKYAATMNTSVSSHGWATSASIGARWCAIIVLDTRKAYARGVLRDDVPQGPSLRRCS